MPHDYLHPLYDSLNDSPMQRKLRALCPLPIGVVYVQQWQHGPDEMRHNLRPMRELGFDTLKQFQFSGEHQFAPGEAELIALEEGVCPWFYGIGGWQEITPELLKQLGIDASLAMPAIQAHPAMLEYQGEVLRRRARRDINKPESPIKGGLGEPARNDGLVAPAQTGEFIAWLREQYQTPQRCARAYKLAGENVPQTWEELAAPMIADDGAPARLGWTDLRRVRDVMRFQADRHFRGINAVATWSQSWDKDAPIRTGCHMIFENQALSGWDFEWQAAAIKDAGSFYASFHPAHHLNEVAGELEIGAYLTAKLVHDFFKGGWSAMWESVGGPSVYSGSFPFGADGSTIAKCLFCYLGAGLKGAGIWSWNVRDSGWETGEYALCDLTGQPTSRAVEAGKIARACQQWRFELWQARDEPRVGIFYGWENDAAFARLSMGGYPLERLAEFPTLPSEARIGAARAFLNAHVPFEFVTARDLERGLAPRYQTILVPHTLCLSEANLRVLREYAEGGGHVVIDAPTLLWNTDGLLFDTRKGSDFERLFGLEHAELQPTFAHPLALGGAEIGGQTFGVNVTSARVIETYDDSARPAHLENRVGAGRATTLTFEASRLCHQPNNQEMENRLVRACIGDESAPWTSDAPLWILARRAPAADHFFLINREMQDAETVLRVRDGAYQSALDAVSGQALECDGASVKLSVPADGGRWVRLLR